MDTLHIDRPCPEWQAAAWRARLVAENGNRRRVLAILGPEDPAGQRGAGTAGRSRTPPPPGGGESALPALERAREEARPLLGRRDPGVLPLVAVQQVGARTAWVYEHVRALGTGHLLRGERGPLLPLSVAAELVAAAARTLLGAGEVALRHPGPLPDDLLIDPRGRLHVAGFVGPLAPDPVMRDPRGDLGREALVYRLGVLFAALVTGQLPPATADRSAHESMLRRTVIRAMARPDSGFEGRYRDWMVGMLSWEANERPALSRVAEALLPIGRATGGPTLEAWADAEIEDLRARAGAPPVESSDSAPRREQVPDPWAVAPDDENPTEEGPMPYIGAMRTVPGLRLEALQDEDDTTAESARPGTQLPAFDPQDSGARSRAAAAAGRRSGHGELPSVPSEKGTIPVGVGPPPEAVRAPPRLPSGFLDAAEAAPASGRPAPRREDPAVAILPSSRTLVLLSLVLAAVAVLVGIYLF